MPTPPAECYRVRVAPPRRGRDRGCWCLRVYGPDLPKYGQRELTDVSAAQPGSRARAEGVARKRQRDLNGEGLALMEVYEAWQASQARSAVSTRRNHESTRRWLEQSEFAGLRDGDLSAARVLDMRAALESGAGKVSSGRQRIMHVSQAWRWAQIKALVSQEWPHGLPKWKAPHGERSRKGAYTEGEVRDLLAHLRDLHGGRYFALAWLLAETGARSTVCRSLRAKDVQVLPGGAGEVSLRRRKVGPDLTAVVSPALVAQFPLDGDPDAYLFPSPKFPGRCLGKTSLWRVIAEWVESRGLKGLRDVHSLRRRGASQLHRSAVPTEIGRRILGQSSQVFLDYAAKAHYDLTEERRILWLDLSPVAQLGPTGSTGPTEEAAGPMDTSGANSTGSDPTREFRAVAGLCGFSAAQPIGPVFRALLSRAAPSDSAGHVLRGLFVGSDPVR